MPEFAPFKAKLRVDGQPELVIAAFAHAYEQLAAGATGLIAEDTLSPVEDLPTLSTLQAYRSRGEAALDRLAVLKLNGGLGTSMGMERAKSLLPVKDGQRFIDLIADQLVALRRRYRARLPLLTMDSFRTRDDTLAALSGHPVLDQALPPSFLQHRVPKVRAADLAPATHTDDELTWCPPGHGDIYLALATSGALTALLEAGFTHAFASNADNLGASPDPAILGWALDQNLPFVMECAARTTADRKGGHLARNKNGLLLRELAQCPDADLAAFQDIARHRYFNTNNLWFDLRLVQQLVTERAGRLGLPLIRNRKPLDPARPEGEGAELVYQLETAMGSALSLFPGAAALEVGRDRFMPVKTTSDLLVMASDVYGIEDGGRLVARAPAPTVDLDPDFYGLIDDFQRRIDLTQPPSLAQCRRLTVRGDITFGPGVVLRGEVTLHADTPQTLAHVTLGEP